MHHIRTYTINLIPVDGGYRAVCPGLPACAAEGASQKEALQRVEELIRDRIREAVVRGQPLPMDRTSIRFLWVNTEEFLV